MSPEISKLVALSMQDIHDLLHAIESAQAELPLGNHEANVLNGRWNRLEDRLLEQMRSKL